MIDEGRLNYIWHKTKGINDTELVRFLLVWEERYFLWKMIRKTDDFDEKKKLWEEYDKSVASFYDMIHEASESNIPLYAKMKCLFDFVDYGMNGIYYNVKTGDCFNDYGENGGIAYKELAEFIIGRKISCNKKFVQQ